MSDEAPNYFQQIAHLRMLADNYDGSDSEAWDEAAGTIGRLLVEMDRAARRLEAKQDPPRYAAEILRAALRGCRAGDVA